MTPSDHEVESLHSVEFRVQLIPSRRRPSFSHPKMTETGRKGGRNFVLFHTTDLKHTIKKAILRWKDRKNSILSGEIQNTPLAMLVGRSGHCPVPHGATQRSRAAQLPAETSQALAHSSWRWESRCSFEITAF